MDIADIRNETDENGIRIAIELKKGANTDFVIKLIENKTGYTDYNADFHASVIEDGRAKIKSLKEILLHIHFLKEINKRKYSLLENFREKEEAV